MTISLDCMYRMPSHARYLQAEVAIGNLGHPRNQTWAQPHLNVGSTAFLANYFVYLLEKID
jgi:hypothetical protein